MHTTRCPTAPSSCGCLELGAAQPPDDLAGLARWLRDGAGELVEAIRTVGPQTPVWSWADDQRVGFWARRMVHEIAVHRADIELALGHRFALEAELAADAIFESAVQPRHLSRVRPSGSSGGVWDAWRSGPYPHRRG